MIVCRRVEDSQVPHGLDRGHCPDCGKDVFLTPNPENEPILCIHCCAAKEPRTALFVQLPPDEFGPSLAAKSVGEVYAAQGGEWHKTGAWLNARDAIGQGE